MPSIITPADNRTGKVQLSRINEKTRGFVLLLASTTLYAPHPVSMLSECRDNDHIIASDTYQFVWLTKLLLQLHRCNGCERM